MRIGNIGTVEACDERGVLIKEFKNNENSGFHDPASLKLVAKRNVFEF